MGSGVCILCSNYHLHCYSSQCIFRFGKDSDFSMTATLKLFSVLYSHLLFQRSLVWDDLSQGDFWGKCTCIGVKVTTKFQKRQLSSLLFLRRVFGVVGVEVTTKKSSESLHINFMLQHNIIHQLLTWLANLPALLGKWWYSANNWICSTWTDMICRTTILLAALVLVSLVVGSQCQCSTHNAVCVRNAGMFMRTVHT